VDWSGGLTAADLPTLALIAVLGASGLLLSQAAYRGGGLAAPLATLTVVNPVVAAAVGITMFGETFRYGTTGTILALSCGVVAAGGLILLTTERLQHATHTDAPPSAFPAPASPVSSVSVASASSAPQPAGSGRREHEETPAVSEESARPVPATAAALTPVTAQDVLDEEPIPYGAFYGIPYVPIPTSARDRHRMRVKS
jgi:hypothetical protein